MVFKYTTCSTDLPEHIDPRPGIQFPKHAMKQPNTPSQTHREALGYEPNILKHARYQYYHVIIILSIYD